MANTKRKAKADVSARLPGAEQRRLFQLMFADGPLGVGVVDNKFKICMANRRLCEMLGYAEREVLGRQLDEITHPDDVDVDAELAQSLFSGDIPAYHIEKRYCRKDESDFWALQTASLIHDEKGGVTYCVCVVEDIGDRRARRQADEFEAERFRVTMIEELAERRRTERALKESERRFRRLVEHASDSFFLIDWNGRILDVNQCACDSLGYARDELLQLSVPDIDITMSSTEKVRKGMRRLAKRLPMTEETTLRRKDGAMIPVEVRVGLVESEGHEMALVLARDITDRKTAQERLKKYQDQLRSLASETSLAEERERRRIATEIHDSIIQSLGLARIKFGALREAIGGDTTRFTEIDGLLEQTIQDTRFLMYELSPPILYELGFEAAVEWLADRLQSQNGLHCEIHDDGERKPLDEDIAVFLFQAMRELLINVRKHAQASRLDVFLSRDGTHIQIRVEDDGIGFDMSALEEVDRETEGFGLFSIRERVELVDGRVEIRSAPGKGTRIKILAPLSGTAT